MSNTLSVEKAVERARRLQDDRITAVRDVATARQNVINVRAETDRELADLQAKIAERISTAEREDAQTYRAALKAGWTEKELREIGFAEPDKKRRTRRGRATSNGANGTNTGVSDAASATQEHGANADADADEHASN